MEIEKDTSQADIEKNTSRAGVEVVVVPNVELEYVPKIGKEFDSLDSAYDFYNAYARMAGFSIRKSKVRKDPSRTVTLDKIFCCSMEGKRCEISDVRTRPMAQMRCGCKAYMRIHLNSSGKYVIWALNESHNHGMLPSSMSHCLRSQRRITASQATQANIVERAGVIPSTVLNLMSTQAGGIKNLGFVRDNYSNYICTRNKIQMKKGDRGELTSYFQKRLCEDRLFFHAIQLDEDDIITNIFWADGQMVVDYQYFGDVVSFDTTFKTNTENHPLALFVGLNHHRHTVVFGVALLYEESDDAFSWLFKTFVNCMHGKAPKTFITDQDQAMAKAIQFVLPQTVHRNCVWHMDQNAAKHLSAVFHKCNGFVDAFKNCIYKCENDVEFEEAWQTLLQRFNLSGNEWLETKYREREKWSLAYGRSHFCADMLITPISESINVSIKNELNRHKSMMRLLDKIDIVVVKHRYNELVCDGNMILRKKEPCVDHPLFRHACKVYTPTVYERIENEAIEIWSCKIQDSSKSGNIEIFKIVNKTENIYQEYTVTYNCENHNIECSCKKFEFVGILCKHIFLVFYFRDVNKIPEQYILKRWGKDAKNGWKDFKYLHASSTSNEATEISNRFSYICPTLVQIGSRAVACQRATNFVMKMAKKMQEGVEKILDGSVLKELPKDVEASCSNDHMTESFSDDIASYDDEGGHNIDISLDDAIHVEANEYAYESHPSYVEKPHDTCSANDEEVMSQKLLEKSKGVNIKERSKRVGMSVPRRVDALTQASQKKRCKPSVQNLEHGDILPGNETKDRNMESPNQNSAQIIPQSADVHDIYHYQQSQLVPTQSMLQVLQAVKMSNHCSSSPKPSLSRDKH